MITFIAKPIFFKEGVNGGKYPVRLSSRIRGEEIANYIGGEYTQFTEPDLGGVRIHLKPRSLRKVEDGEYIDILDALYLIPELKKRPNIKVIAYNKPYYDFLNEELGNEVFYIPHPHINFENKTRVKNDPIVGGMIGKSSPVSYKSFNAVKEVLSKVGIEFKECFTHESREEVLNFYQQIDFQVIWYEDIPVDNTRFLRYSGKIINAASFGIPTIAQRIVGHSEMEGYYIPAESYEDVAKEAIKLNYDEWSNKLIEKAKEYHISKIAELYKKL